MRQERIPKPGQIYRHFKNKLYQIITVARHTETGEEMVVYQALYGNFKTYVRPLAMFVSEVDRGKYPAVTQRYRFEEVILKEEDTEFCSEGVSSDCINPDRDSVRIASVSQDNEEEGTINPILLSFLEADTYEKKLAVIISQRKYLNDKILNDMAVSLDCTIDDGILEERIDEFIYCLQTMARFEGNRFR